MSFCVLSIGVYSNKKSLFFLGPKTKNSPTPPSKLPKNRRNITEKRDFFSPNSLFFLEILQKLLIIPTNPPCAFGRIYIIHPWSSGWEIIPRNPSPINSKYPCHNNSSRKLTIDSGEIRVLFSLSLSLSQYQVHS